MNFVHPFQVLKRARLCRRAARVRRQRLQADVPPPWMLPDPGSLIASYPRSGNTWLSHMVADVLLQNNGYQTETVPPINEREIIPDLDRGDLERCQHSDFAKRPVAKTHLEYMQWMQKGVFLIRQPADVLVSYYHFHKRYPERLQEVAAGIEPFCRKFAEQWYAHALSFIWKCEEDPQDFKAVTYEALMDRTHESLGFVLAHLEIDFTDRQLSVAVANHEFQKHSAREVSNGSPKFFRNGKKNSAKSELPSKLFHWINRLCGPLYRRASERSFPTGDGGFH
ncbi:MAG: sulfotransferase domain-containing protein [Planctomycetota bacterium]|nr:sulfotransferase domain-containing protein [Planctomycetota bacterium]